MTHQLEFHIGDDEPFYSCSACGQIFKATMPAEDMQNSQCSGEAQADGWTYTWSFLGHGEGFDPADTVDYGCFSPSHTYEIDSGWIPHTSDSGDVIKQIDNGTRLIDAWEKTRKGNSK